MKTPEGWKRIVTRGRTVYHRWGAPLVQVYRPPGSRDWHIYRHGSPEEKGYRTWMEAVKEAKP